MVPESRIHREVATFCTDSSATELRSHVRATLQESLLIKMATSQIAFFVGSGVSRPSKAPTVADLTNRVLESAWRFHTDGSVCPVQAEEGRESIGRAANAQNLIRLVHQQIEGHIVHRERRSPNYEDYFACLKQIVQDETGEVVNPLITRKVDALKAAASSLYLQFRAHIDDNRFASLAKRSTDLIQWIVVHELWGIEDPVGMALLTDSAKVFEEIDIFTLNHDLLVEKQLESKNVAYVDGFGEPDGDALLFNGSWDQDGSSVRLFKLHGSVDWHQFRFKSRGVDRYAKLRKEPYPYYSRDADGDPFRPSEIGPSFLTGTTVKEQAYGYGLYGELFEQLRHRLRKHDTLVFSGYGWGDKGINTRINQWLREQTGNRIVILHGNGEEEVRRKQFWYWNWKKYGNYILNLTDPLR